jgi:hypothetical protein
MATTDLMIGIGAEYKGKGAFGKANKDVSGLSKGVSNLAKAYIGLAGAQKAFRYAAASVKAFAEDDLAAQKLSKTLSNLGLAYESTNVENFIAGLEKTFHIADDFLRPAFAQLISTTQSYTKSQELMRVALDASVGSGESLDTTVNDLTQAYVGNTKGLTKYKLGLTKAELAAKSFDEIQQIIAKRFSGQASQALDTYAYKLNALTIASGNAKEIIGRGLTDALTSALGGGDINRATTNMEKLAQVVSDIIAGLGTMTGAVLNFRVQSEELTSSDFMGATKRPNPNIPFDPMAMKAPDLTPAFMKLIKERKKADEEAAKRQRELAALTKKQAKAEKERLALARLKKIEDKASLLFNMDLIQNTAALMGKVTQDETLRLKTQQAILLGNSEEAGAYAQQLLSAQTAAAKLANINPVGSWTDAFKTALDALRQLREELASLGIPTVKVPSTNKPTATTPSMFDQGLFPFVPLSGNGIGYDSKSPALTNTELRIYIDPTAAQYGINAASIGASANGNSNNYSTIQSFKGGTGL